MEDQSEVEVYLDSKFDSDEKNYPSLLPVSQTHNLSKIEKAGENVMKHLIKLVMETDLSYTTMAKRLNELYALRLNSVNIHSFLKKNFNYFQILANQRKKLNKIRADLYLEHNGVLVKDIKILDQEIDNLVDDDMLEVDKRAKAIADLIERKGTLLMRYSRMAGKINNKPEHSLQVNVFQQINEEKSDIINRLKKVEFNKNVINVKNKNED